MEDATTMSDKNEQIDQAPKRDKPTIVEGPPGYTGAGFFATSADKVIGMARKNSLWPLPFATSCCGIEFMSLMSSHYDLARFGMGACASSGGIFDTYSVLQGIDRIIPVDVYVPGCPPRPEQVIDGIMKIQELAQNEGLRRRYSKEYEDLLTKYKID